MSTDRSITNNMDADRKLFRDSALLHHIDKYSQPFSAPKVRTLWIAGLMAALFISFVTYALLANFPRRESVLGQIRPAGGISMITSPRSGNVIEIRVKPGDNVKEGDLLAIVTSERMDQHGKPYGQMHESLIEQQTEARSNDIEAQISKLLDESKSLRITFDHYQSNLVLLREEVDLHAHRADDARKTVDDLKSLLEDRYLSQVQFRQYEAQRVDAYIALNNKRRELEMQTDLLSTTMQRERSIAHEIRSLKSRLEQESAQSRERQLQIAIDRRTHIVSPLDGTVASVSVDVGTHVDPAVRMISVHHLSDSYEAELWIPSRSAGLIEEGLDVNIMVDSFPYQRFGVLRGKVVQVSKNPISSVDMLSTRDSRDSAYLVVASIEKSQMSAYGRDWKITSGMSIKADVILENRSIAEWIIDPLIALRARNAEARFDSP